MHSEIAWSKSSEAIYTCTYHKIFVVWIKCDEDLEIDINEKESCKEDELSAS